MPFTLLLKRITLLLVCTSLYMACKQKASVLEDGHPFWRYYDKGDSFYINKKGIEAFEKSLLYYDSAYAIADTTTDLLAKAHINLAIGRVYDAAKFDPQKTLLYYKKASEYFNQLKKINNQIFCDYLTIHAYATAKDSVNTIEHIQKLLKQIDTVTLRKYYNMQTVCAFEATEVNNYAYAKEVINKIDSPQTLVNSGIKYADKYKIVQAKLELHDFKNKKNNILQWQDSVQAMLNATTLVYDSIDYIQLLHQYAGSKNDSSAATSLFNLENRLRVKTSDEQLQLNLQQKLFSHEMMEKDLTTKNLLAAKKNSQLVGLIFVIITLALVVISLILFTQKKEVAKQKQYLEAANKQLALKIIDNKTLTKELHHRVKNNLYLIDSLLKLQEEKLVNTASQKHLQAARLRVESIALLHEALISKENSSFSFKQLVEQILKTAADTIVSNSSLTYNLIIDDFANTDIDVLFPLSLIVNEWVTNSLKYAVVNNNALHIDISILIEASNIKISYSDNGNMESGITSTPGLGSSIVNLLSKQVNGILQTNASTPYSYILNIPYHG